MFGIRRNTGRRNLLNARPEFHGSERQQPSDKDHEREVGTSGTPGLSETKVRDRMVPDINHRRGETVQDAASVHGTGLASCWCTRTSTTSSAIPATRCRPHHPGHLRPVNFIGTMRVDEACSSSQKTAHHVAVVVDEFGGTAACLPSNVVETIVGVSRMSMTG